MPVADKDCEGNMRRQPIPPSGKERHFEDDEIIVTKTDTRGIITYANEVFLRVAGYTEREVLGQPHNLIRHPDMPMCVFKFLWDTIESGREIFAYVVNQAKNGDSYWVLAHVTPTYNGDGKIIGYHSNRRTVNRAAIPTIEAIYRDLRKAEAAHTSSDAAMQAGVACLLATLRSAGMSYDEFVFSLEAVHA
jgi:PAS domain S-box-containing protein